MPGENPICLLKSASYDKIFEVTFVARGNVVVVAESDCVNPGKPANGRRIGDKFNFGDVVKFDCSTGFSLVGSQKRKCQKDGNWTGIPATCEGLLVSDR